MEHRVMPGYVVQWMHRGERFTSRILSARGAARACALVARLGEMVAWVVPADRAELPASHLTGIMHAYPKITGMRRDTDGTKYNTGSLRRFANCQIDQSFLAAMSRQKRAGHDANR